MFQACSIALCPLRQLRGALGARNAHALGERFEIDVVAIAAAIQAEAQHDRQFQR